MAATNEKDIYTRAIGLVTPSSVSAVSSVILGIVISLGAIFINRYRPGRLELSITNTDSHFSINNSYLMGSLSQNKLLLTLPSICFWLILFVFLYLVTLDVLNLSKNKLKIDRLLKRIFVRVLAFGLLTVYIWILFGGLLNYAVRIAIYSTTASSVLAEASYIVLSVLLIAIGINILVILMRLLFLKSRLVNL